MLYAFNAASNSQTPVWSKNLASAVMPGSTFVSCSDPNVNFGPCDDPEPVGNDVGVTGTPVIDADSNLLYVVAAVDINTVINYYIFAVDISSGTVMAQKQILGSVTGSIPTNPDSIGKCTTSYPNTGTVSFDSGHIQRSALVLLNHNMVYVPFSPADGEWENGWIFGYRYDSQNSSFTQVAVLNTTPYGTGGGIWQSGAGLAAEVKQDGTTYLYGSTGNGTFDVQGIVPVGNDLGDTMLKMSVNNTSGALSVVDYYTPSDVATLPGDKGTGRCKNDVDFASGGVLLFPDTFYTDQNHNNSTPRMMVNADKESKLFVLNRDTLGHYNPSDGNFIERLTTPPITDSGQGYWASPAYLKYVDSNQAPHYLLYYSVTTHTNDVIPYQLDMYELLQSGSTGPISSSGPTASSQKVDSTPIRFCVYSPTPTVSSNGTTAGTGIVWAIENQNSHNPGNPSKCDGDHKAAALHAFNATSMVELYSSGGITGASIGRAPQFITPTVFQGRVYMGTANLTGVNVDEVDVFGLCGSSPLPACIN